MKPYVLPLALWVLIPGEGKCGFGRSLVFVKRPIRLSVQMNDTWVARRHLGFAREGPAWAGCCGSVRSWEKFQSTLLWLVLCAVSNPENKHLAWDHEAVPVFSVGSPAVRELRIACCSQRRLFSFRKLSDTKSNLSETNYHKSLPQEFWVEALVPHLSCVQLPGLAPYKALRRVKRIKPSPILKRPGLASRTRAFLSALC